MRISIPQITDIDTAIRIYYRYPEIGSKEMTELFVRHSRSTINRLKKLAFEQMIKENVYRHGMYKINTASAYKAWGIDVEDLTNRREKLRKLGL